MHPDAQRWLRPDYQRHLRPGYERDLLTQLYERKEIAIPPCVAAEVPDASAPEESSLRRLFAELKFELALRRVERKYSPDQPRDGRGRWTEGGTSTGPANESPNDDNTPTDVSAARRVPGGIAKEFWSWTVRQFVSRHCKGQINRELPAQFENVTIADLLELRKGGDAAADKCYKLLNQPRFRK